MLKEVSKINVHKNRLILASKNRRSILKRQTKQTFMSSTKEGNPPMVMKVKNAVINMISEPLTRKTKKTKTKKSND